jgi:hypothetical protein
MICYRTKQKLNSNGYKHDNLYNQINAEILVFKSI